MTEPLSMAVRARRGTALVVLATLAAVLAGLWIRTDRVPGLSDFSTVFLSILLEAFPFVLLGTFISSVIHLFVTPALLERVIPKNRLLGLLVASVTGFAFPICECANVPVMRRLVVKGLPLPVAVTFLLSVAIVNPVVLFSTWIAFGGDWRVVVLRGGLGMVIAIASGWLVGLLPDTGSPLREQGVDPDTGKPCGIIASHANGGCCDHDHTGQTGHCEHSDNSDNNAHNGPVGASQAGRRQGLATLIREVLEHTADELYGVGRFLVMGAAVAAIMQTVLPRAALVGIGMAPFASILVLMFLAYVLSLCSEADAFIAATFAGYFTPGAVMAFMVYGPMMDIKNTLMLLEGFKPRFVMILFALTTMLCLLAGLAVNQSGLWGGF